MGISTNRDDVFLECISKSNNTLFIGNVWGKPEAPMDYVFFPDLWPDCRFLAIWMEWGTNLSILPGNLWFIRWWIVRAPKESKKIKNVSVERLYSPSTETKGKQIWPSCVEPSWWQSPWSTFKALSRCTGYSLHPKPDISVKRGFLPQIHIQINSFEALIHVDNMWKTSRSSEIGMMSASKRTSRGMTLGCATQACGTVVQGTAFRCDFCSLNITTVKQWCSQTSHSPTILEGAW